MLAAAWSPDGSRLAIVRRGRLVVRGRVVARVPRALPGSRLAWSPQGTRIAVAVPRGVLVVPYASRGVARVRFGPGARDPAWAPNGRRMVFVRRGELRISALGGGDASRPMLADVPGAPTGPASGPDYRPDGRALLFAAEGALYVYTFTGPVLRRVAPAGLPDASDGAWSPDGRRIAFVVRTGLYVSGADGDHPRRVVRGPLLRAPRWHPVSDR